jgi:hypothetical protein
MTVATTTQAPDLEALPVETPGQVNAEVQQQRKDVPVDEELPPFRIHASRVPERLHSSYSSVLGGPQSGWSSPALHHHVRRRSLPSEFTKPRSRSVSPSMRDTTGDSSISSLEDDSDILTDRMGLEELDFEKQRSLADGLSVSSLSLQPVNERLSEDTLEDVHAFSDVTRTTGSVSSRANSICTGGDVGSLLLETLDEVDDEGGEADEGAGVHISNLDEIHEEGPDGAPNLENLPSEERQHYFYTDEDTDSAPLHFNACRVTDLLSASHSSCFPPQQGAASPSGGRKLFSSRSDSGGSGRGLALMKRKDADGNSSISSLEVVDQDILTDRMGFQELDMEKQRSKTELLGSSSSSLQPVNERMSEDTLEDVRAFSDAVARSTGGGASVASSGLSRANSITTGGDVGSLFLETLDEEEDEEDDEVDDGAVHISNLAKLTIQEDAKAAGMTKPSDTSAEATT